MIRVCVLATAALLAGEALGHAALLASEPADGAVLERGPTAIELRFDEPVTPIAIRLLDRSGASVALSATGDGVTVRAPLPATLPDGPYLLSFRVTSLDSHPVAGAIAFSVGSTERVPASSALDMADGGAPLRNGLRIVHDLALLVAAGGGLFAVLVTPFPRQRFVLTMACAVAGLCAIAAVGLHGAALLDATVTDGVSWRVGFATSRGTAALATLAGTAAIAAGALQSVGRPASMLLAAGALMSIVGFALTGHSAAAEPRAVAATLVLAHVLAAAFWAGSLVGLLAILRRSREPAAALARFSDFGALAVLALVIAGVAFAAIQLDSLSQVVASRYGLWIVAKSALLAGLLALAAWNRLGLLPALESGEPRAGVTLRRTVAAEIVLIAGAIAAAAILAQTPPPRAASDRAVVVLTEGDYAARLTVAPARAGANAITISFSSGRDAFDPAEVSLELANPTVGVEPILRRPKRVAPGDYRLEGSELAFAGAWTIEIHARVSDFDRVTFRGRLVIR